MDKYTELKRFILDRTYKKKYTMDNLSPSLGIEKDLGFDGDDAAEFIYDYGDTEYMHDQRVPCVDNQR